MNMNTSTTKLDNSAPFSEDEWQQRTNLAAALHLAEQFGWTMLIWNHISARVPGASDQFLMNRHGLMYDEARASDLPIVDIHGAAIDGEDEVAPAGFVIHGAVYAARPDAGCVVHSHTPEGVAISCLEDGIPQLCGETAYFHNDLVYYDYAGVSLDLDEQEHIANCLGDKNFMIMKNHGLTTVGRTIPEAFMRMYWLIYCCRIMTNIYATGRPYKTLAAELADAVAAQDGEVAAPGAYEWAALLRRLDRTSPSYKS